MIYTPLTKHAMRVCFAAHREQLDKAGLPYVLHPLHVAESMNDELSTVCALLHDVVEDTDITLTALGEMGFPSPVLDVLALLTRQEDVPYMDYIKKIATNPVARQVKLADLAHNCDLSRLDIIDEVALTRREKYLDAIELLMK